MQFNRKLLILPPVAAGIALLAYVATHKSPPKTKPPAETVRHVRVFEVQPGNVVPSVKGFGAVTPGNKWTATSQVGGEIVHVHPGLKKGAVLKAGDEIVRVSPADYEIAVKRAEANIRGAVARIDELAVSEKNTGEGLEIEKRALKLLEEDLGRQTKLLARGAASQTAVDNKTRDVLAQRKKVLDLQSTLRLLPVQKAQQESQKAVSEAELQQARLNLARTSIKLPFDARIVSVEAELAQYAQPGQTLATADSVATAEVEAQVPLQRFRNMVSAIHGAGRTGPIEMSEQIFATMVQRIGFQATVRLATGDEVIEWPARFARISDTIDPKTRTVGVIVVADGPYENLVPGKRPPLAKGLFVEVELRARALEGQLLVPRGALHEGRAYVVGADGRLEIRAVETGLRQGNVATVAKGLKAGDRIVVSDLSPAVPGMALKVTLDTALADAVRREALASATGEGGQ
jgi:multidrug efflux system membrane fusion protein